MRLAGIAGLVAMLLFLLPAFVDADETPLEHQVRTYLRSHGRYHQLFAQPDDARLGRLTCGTAGRVYDLMCVIPVGELGGGRFFVSHARGHPFDFRACHYDYRGLSDPRDYEENPCYGDIARG